MGMSTSRTVQQARTTRAGEPIVGANTGRLADGRVLIDYPVNRLHASDQDHPTRGRCGVGPPWESTLQRTDKPDQVNCPACVRELVRLGLLPPPTQPVHWIPSTHQ